MRKINSWMVRLSVLSVVVFLAACQAEIDKEQAPTALLEVGVAPVEKTVVAMEYELSGRVNAIQKAEIRPQVGGVLQKRLYEEGAQVNQGEALYQIDDALLKAEMQSAEAAVKRAEASLNAITPQASRYAKLVAVKAVSQQENEQVQAQLLQAQAELVSAKAVLNRIKTEWEYTIVRAPIAGTIGVSAVTVGSLLSPSQTTALTTIQDVDQVYVDMNQSTAQWFDMRDAIADSTAEVTLLLANGRTYEHTGTLVFNDVQVDPASSTVHVRAVFPNPEKQLLPGMYVQAIVQGGNQNVYVIPQQAVQRDVQGTATVWVVNAEEQAEPKQVEILRALGNQWVVHLDSLTDGAVITEGIQKLRPNMPVRVRNTQAEAKEVQ